MDTLLRMQTAYEIAQARSREDEIRVEKYTPVEKTLAEEATAN